MELGHFGKTAQNCSKRLFSDIFREKWSKNASLSSAFGPGSEDESLLCSLDEKHCESRRFGHFSGAKEVLFRQKVTLYDLPTRGLSENDTFATFDS